MSNKKNNNLKKEKKWTIVAVCLLTLSAILCGVIISLNFYHIDHQLQSCNTAELELGRGFYQLALLLPSIICIAVFVFAMQIKMRPARYLLIIGALALILISYVTISMAPKKAIENCRNNYYSEGSNA